MKKELNEQFVIDLSKKKNEPEWMLEFRLDALRKFKKMPMPQFGRQHAYTVTVTVRHTVRKVFLDSDLLLQIKIKSRVCDTESSISEGFSHHIGAFKYSPYREHIMSVIIYRVIIAAIWASHTLCGFFMHASHAEIIKLHGISPLHCLRFEPVS